MQKDLKRILYLEDDPSIAEIAQLSLRDISGYDVLHCSSGREAIDKYSDFAPDLLLFDVMLPDLDGRQTLQHIRAEHGRTTAPVIFMTAKAQTHEQQKYMDEGALSVIVKPFDAFTLGAHLQSLWQTRRQHEYALDIE